MRVAFEPARDGEADLLRDPLRLGAPLAGAPDRQRLVAVAEMPLCLDLSRSTSGLGSAKPILWRSRSTSSGRPVRNGLERQRVDEDLVIDLVAQEPADLLQVGGGGRTDPVALGVHEVEHDDLVPARAATNARTTNGNRRAPPPVRPRSLRSTSRAGPPARGCRRRHRARSALATPPPTTTIRPAARSPNLVWRLRHSRTPRSLPSARPLPGLRPRALPPDQRLTDSQRHSQRCHDSQAIEQCHLKLLLNVSNKGCALASVDARPCRPATRRSVHVTGGPIETQSSGGSRLVRR